MRTRKFAFEINWPLTLRFCFIKRDHPRTLLKRLWQQRAFKDLLGDFHFLHWNLLLNIFIFISNFGYAIRHSTFKTFAKSYIPSTLNTDCLFCHTQLIVTAGWIMDYIMNSFTFQVFWVKIHSKLNWKFRIKI